MKTIMISDFCDPFGMEIVRQCSERGLPVNAIVFVGDRHNDETRQIMSQRMPDFRPQTITDFESLKIPVYFARKLNRQPSLDLLRTLAPDVVLQGGGPIYKSPVLSIPTIGVLNCHPGLLPRYRGCCAVEWALCNDEPVGASCHFLDEGIDTGPIVLRAVMDVYRGDTYEAIRTRMFKHQVETMVSGLELVRSGMTQETAEVQRDGTYWKVAPVEILENVRRKLHEGTYGCYASALRKAG